MKTATATKESGLDVGRRRLGDVLVSAGVLGEEALADALADQNITHQRLGEILTANGQLRDQELAAALATLFGLEVVDLSVVVPDENVVTRLPEALARRLNALPLMIEDGAVLVAVDDPSNVVVLDDLRAAIASPVRFVVATADQLRRTIEATWQPDLDGIPLSDDFSPASGAIADQELASAVVDDAPVVRLVSQLLIRGVHERASDIHIETSASGGRIRFRVDGMLHDVLTIAPEAARSTVSRLKVMAGLDIAQRRLPQDGRMSLRLTDKDVDVRVATLPTVHGESVVLRVLDKSSGGLELEEIGFLPDTLATFEAAYRRPYGSILVTGPTGSGKTSTLYAALNHLNAPERNIITVEDPVEYELAGIKQVQVSEQTGLTFPRILRATLRCDPDIILVGEIRDEETAHIVAEAAITGHLVLSTLHTNDAASTPTRLVEMGLEPFLVASSINCVLTQRLARRLCKACRQRFTPNPTELAAAGWPSSGLLNPDLLYKAVGCSECRGTGYDGRFALHEVMPITHAIRELILANAPATKLHAQAVTSGMRPMWVDGLCKAAEGRTSLEELARVVTSAVDEDTPPSDRT